MKKTWVVVANASTAKFFSARNARGELELVAELTHPESRLRNQDLVSDAQKDHNNARHAAPHDGERALPKTQEMVRFAHELAARLKAGRLEGAFERLIVVATPHFKGMLLDALDDATAKCVEKSIDKDYTHEDHRSLSERLADVIRFAA
jgi:protein required for attachment to host cells